MVLAKVWRARLIPDQDRNKPYAKGNSSQGKAIDKAIPNAVLFSRVQHSSSQLIQVLSQGRHFTLLSSTYPRLRQV